MPRKNLVTLHEAIVLALIANPVRSMNYKEIADFIAKRNLYPIRKGNIPLEKQIMLRATKAKGAYAHLFEDEGMDIISLKDTNSKFPGMFWDALKAFMPFDKAFFYSDAKDINLLDRSSDSKEIIKLKISPQDIICILSQPKPREKKFYILQKTAAATPVIKSYILNSQKYNFETLCPYLDPLSHYLTRVSRNSIVNVAYYEPVNKHLLQCTMKENQRKAEYYQVKISAKKEDSRFVREFKIIKDAYTRRIQLQRAALGYKVDMGL